MRFAKITFRIAAIWGVLTLIPLYFMFDIIGRQIPPPITHAEYYFGFLSVTLAWQLAFFMISSDPVRFRPMMLLAILEKMGYVVTLLALFEMRRIGIAQMLPDISDFLLGILFIVSYLKTK